MKRKPTQTAVRAATALSLAWLLAVTAAPAIAQKAAQKPLTDAEMVELTALQAQPNGRWKDGLTFDGMEPQPWLKNTVNWYPNSETVQPNEMRVTFMGSSPLPRPGQMGTALYVGLGNGDRFVFDMGPAAITNYLAAGIPLNQINNIFITHLHYDTSLGALPLRLRGLGRALERTAAHHRPIRAHQGDGHRQHGRVK